MYISLLMKFIPSYSCQVNGTIAAYDSEEGRHRGVRKSL